MLQLTIYDALASLKGEEGLTRESSRLKNDSPKNNPSIKTSLGESKKRRGKPFTQSYKPRGKARGENQYFHLKYKTKSGEWKECHICGGNIFSPVAQRKKKAIDEAIAQNKPIDELLRMCK